MKTTSKKLSVVCLVLAIVMILNVAVLAACGDTKTYYNNSEDPIVFSTLELDGVFNPFFSTSATDSSIVGMTQIGMLGNNENGEPTYGDDEGVVVKDMQIVDNGGVQDHGLETTYYFVLKNNVQFSNGSYLTMKDVLFNLYVYLDPAYTGSSTIYSTEIVGLQEYRTQAASENEQDSFMDQFNNDAKGRVSKLIMACNEVLKDAANGATPEAFSAALKNYVDNNPVADDSRIADYNKAVSLFNEEVAQDYSNSLNSYQDQTFKDEAGNVSKPFTTDVEMFLYNEGLISWNKKEGKLEYALGQEATEELMAMSAEDAKQTAIEIVIEYYMPSQIAMILTYWNTSVTLFDFMVKEEMEKWALENAGQRQYKNISGIKFANMTESVTVNGVTYGVPTYDNADTKSRVINGNEVLSITIKNVDPKAIWNFAFTVAPMYYYSNAEQIAKFDYVENFGVEYMSQSFMEDVVKASDKIGVPVGAGPYAASKSSGGITNVTAGDFRSLGVVYYESNPYYILGEPKIKKLRYKVVSSQNITNSLYAGEVDFADPSSKPETIAELNGKKDQGIGNKSVRTAGYGYIGINAGKVPSMGVRQAIMHAINTAECVAYYKGTADAIHRSMSLSSWAYPGYNNGQYGTETPTSYYPYIAGPIPADLTKVNPAYAEFVNLKGKNVGDTFTLDEQNEFLRSLVEGAGYSLGGDGIYVNSNGHRLSYDFTIAGDEVDHPAYAALFHAKEVLERVNFSVNVKTDANALTLLASGGLTVWAAAWGSTIDPDMYQVYHKDSNATSVLNWGYKQILQNNGGMYATELGLVEDLSELIEEARTTNDRSERATIYAEALDIVMQLAVELPTYQRDDLFAYNANKIDTSTFFANPTPFKGLTSDVHTLSLVVKAQ